jgi:glutathione S-transferase
MLKLYHAPHSRSSRFLSLLEELGEPYEVEIVDIRRPGGAHESYRAIHPHKKVPALVHDGIVVTESAAICLYLTDAFPAAGLGPQIGERLRGSYLSWLAYAAGVIEPAMFARSMHWEYEPLRAAFGKSEDVEQYLTDTLEDGDYVLGDEFSAADVLIASSIMYGVRIAKVLPESEVFSAYLDRIFARPGIQRGFEKDQEFAAAAQAEQGQDAE